jgi:hypothetical protein
MLDRKPLRHGRRRARCTLRLARPHRSLIS